MSTGRGTGTEHYARFVARIARSYGRKAAAGELDTAALTQLVELRRVVDEQIAATVHALRSADGGAYSWTAVGDALGIGRAAACRKYGPNGWGNVDGDYAKPARRRGGQPAALR